MDDERNRVLEEQLSAAVDGELEDEAWPLLLRRLEAEPALRDRWERFHLIGEVLRRPDEAPRGAGIAARVAAQLADQEEARAPRRGSGALLRPVAGLALAAGVAAVAIMLVTRPAGESPAPAELSPVAQDTQRAVELREHLTPYLVNHNAFSRSTTRQGLLPYVHVQSPPDGEAAPEPGHEDGAAR